MGNEENDKEHKLTWRDFRYVLFGNKECYTCGGVLRKKKKELKEEPILYKCSLCQREYDIKHLSQ